MLKHNQMMGSSFSQFHKLNFRWPQEATGSTSRKLIIPTTVGWFTGFMKASAAVLCPENGRPMSEFRNALAVDCFSCLLQSRQDKTRNPKPTVRWLFLCMRPICKQAIEESEPLARVLMCQPKWFGFSAQRNLACCLYLLPSAKE